MNEETSSLLRKNGIILGSILSLLLLLVVTTNSFALFTSQTDRVTYTFRQKEIVAGTLISGPDFNKLLEKVSGKNGGIKISKIIFETNVNPDLKNVFYKEDVGIDKDSKIILWVDTRNGNDYIVHVSTRAHKIDANSNSSSMFSNLDVSEIILTGLDVTKAKNMSYMFANLKNLESLDLSGFVIGDVDVNNMFINSTNIKEVFVKDEGISTKLSSLNNTIKFSVK